MKCNLSHFWRISGWSGNIHTFLYTFPPFPTLHHTYIQTHTHIHTNKLCSHNFATLTVCAIPLFYIYSETSICFGFAFSLQELLTDRSLYLILVLPLKRWKSACPVGNFQLWFIFCFAGICWKLKRNCISIILPSPITCLYLAATILRYWSADS